MADSHKNFAASNVLTAPVSATAGTSLVLVAGGGALMPTPPFNATVWPASTGPTVVNAEIVRVTALSTDTLTITRAQEGTAARTIVAGDQFAATITARTLTDAESPLTTKGDLFTFGTAPANSVSNPTPTGSSILIAPDGNEVVIPGMNLTATLYSSGTSVAVSINLFVSSSESGASKTWVARLRRGNITGAVLASSGTLNAVFDSTDGHDRSWVTSFTDATPTDGQYVVTIDAGHASATYSDTRAMTVTATGTGSAGSRLPVGTSGQALFADSTAQTGLAWGGGVTSVAGKTGAVTIFDTDVQTTPTAPTFVGATQGFGDGVNSLTLTLPTNAVGDLIVVAARGNGVTINSFPAGWNNLDVSGNMRVAYIISTGAMNSVVITPASNTRVSAVASSYSSTIGLASASLLGSTGPTTTAVDGGQEALIVYAAQYASAITPTAATGTTARQAFSGSGGGIGLFDQPQVAGVIPARTFGADSVSEIALYNKAAATVTSVAGRTGAVVIYDTDVQVAAPAATFVGIATAGIDRAGGDSQSVTMTLPSSQANDLVILYVAAYFYTSGFVTPSGWTLVGSANGGLDYVFSIVSPGASLTSVTVTSNSTMYAGLVAAVYRGVVSATIASSGMTGTTTPVDLGAEALQVILASRNADQITPVLSGPGAPVTQRYSGTPLNRPSMFFGDEPATAGVSTARTITNADHNVLLGLYGAPKPVAHRIKDEGASLTPRANLDFVGAGVTATDDSAGARTVVTIPGSSETLSRKTAAYTAVGGDFVEADASTAAFTVTLPSAPASGTAVTVKKVDFSVNVVTVLPQGSATIDGDPSATIVAQWAGARFVFDGTQWLVAQAVLAPSSGLYVGATARNPAGGSYTLAVPTGAAVGDLCVFVDCAFGNSAALPSGFTDLGEASSTGSVRRLAYAFLTSAQIGSGITATVSSEVHGGAIAVYRGFTTVQMVTSVIANVQSITSPAIPTASKGTAVAIGAGAKYGDANAPGNGWSDRARATAAVDSGYGNALIADRPASWSGVSATWTINASRNFYGSIGDLLILT